MNDPDPYLLGYRPAEQARLERQAHELAHDSGWLFDQVGVRPGWRVVELGCGPQGCLGLLAQRVGTAGHVVGIERSADQVARAQQFVAEQHVPNVEVLHADARQTGLPTQSFDLATARLVLVNVPEPEQLVHEMVRLVRPGGAIALHEPDASTQRCDPPHPAQAQLLALLNTYAEQNGIDRNIGPRLPRLLRDAGVVDIAVNAVVHVYPHGHGRRLLLLEFVANLRRRLLEQQLISEGDLQRLTAALQRHLDEPTTVVLSSVFVQAWGRTAPH